MDRRITVREDDLLSHIEDDQQLFEESAKGTPEHLAYHGIIKALESNDAQAELERRISLVSDAIERHDGEVWHGPRGYRGYYNKQIALYRKALGELHVEDEPSDEDRLERQAQAHLEAAALHRDDPLF
jgi:hypothetical protein